MNWKNILYLIRVERKSGRLLRGQRLIKYNVRRSAVFSYIYYAIAITIGIGIGLLVGYIYGLTASDPNIKTLFIQYFPSILLALPTIILVFSLVFTMLQQIQRSGVKFAQQVPYWLPITWGEHTLAGILSEMIGFPLISIAFVGSAVLVFSLYVGQIALTLGSIAAMVAAAFMASATTEILRILQVRFIGAVYKSSGRAAVWVRFIGSMLFFIVFYIIYFSITTGANSIAFIQAIASGQTSLWYVPFVWLGITLYELLGGFWLLGVGYLAASLLFIAALALLATALNRRYGLYEPPAITISRGVYAPKTGILGRFGFSSVEAAIIRKDLKAFTRRRELMTTFILPVVFLIVPIMTSLNTSAAANTGPPGFTLFWYVYMTLFPSTIMAMSMGSFMTGEEGQSIWRIYMSPISARSYVKSKYAFMLFFALIVLPITTTIGYFLYMPSTRAVIVLAAESVFVVCTVGALSLANGIKGADFNEVPRPRMMRTEWSLISLLTCAAVALVLMLPFFPYMISIFTGANAAPFLDLYTATAISGAVAAVLSVIFYKVAVGNAEELLSKAEL